MATQILDVGVPIAVVSAGLADACTSTTLNVYAHAVPGTDRLAAEMLRSRPRDCGSVTTRTSYVVTL